MIRTRLFNWKISLYILLISIVGVIPFSYSLVLSYRSAAGKLPTNLPRALHQYPTGIRGLQKPTFARLGLFAVPIGVFLFLMSFIPVPTGAASSGITGSVLTRLTTVGTILLGSLSGFGAVDNASRFLPWFSRSNGFVALRHVLTLDDDKSTVGRCPQTQISWSRKRAWNAFVATWLSGDGR